MVVTNMTISIITPVYNSARFIVETYESIRHQTFRNWEWVVVDDCSNDESWELLKNIQDKDERVKVFRNPTNSGAAVSRNRAMDQASGDYIAFIDADDLWLPEKLDIQLKYMLDNAIEFSFTAYEVVDVEGRSLDKVIDKDVVACVGYREMLRKKVVLGCSTVMLSSKLVGDMRMPDLRVAQDYAYWLKLLKRGIFAYSINMSLTKYRIVPGSISRDKLKKAMLQWQLYRNTEKLSLFKSLQCFAGYAYRAIAK